MATGKIKWFGSNKNKDIGFIAGEDNQDYFLHIEHWKSDRSKLKAEARVKFDTQQTQNGQKAINVYLLEDDNQTSSQQPTNYQPVHQDIRLVATL